jgi:hypothetical protein
LNLTTKGKTTELTFKKKRDPSLAIVPLFDEK